MLRPRRLLFDLSRFSAVPAASRTFAWEQVAAMLRLPEVCSGVGVIFLTSPETHPQVRDELARVQDEIVCLAEAGAALAGGLPRERLWTGSERGLALCLGASAAYVPDAVPRGERLVGVPVVGAVWDVAVGTQPGAVAVQGISPEIETIHGERGFLVLPAPVPQAEHPVRKSDGPVVFFPGDLAWEGEHELVLVAFRRTLHLAREAGFGPIVLHLTTGSDQRVAELRALARSLRIEHAVRWHLWRPEELDPAKDVLLLTSPQPAALTQVLAGLARGLPVVTDLHPPLQLACGGALQQVDRRRPDALADALLAICTNAGLRRDLHLRSLETMRSATVESAARLLHTRLAAAADRPPAAFCAGIQPDGWVEDEAIFALPPMAGVAELKLELHPLPAPRHFILRSGDRALGLYQLTPGEPYLLRLRLHVDAQPISLRVPDAASLAPGVDPRRHGVRVASLQASATDGTVVELVPRS